MYDHRSFPLPPKSIRDRNVGMTENDYLLTSDNFPIQMNRALFAYGSKLQDFKNILDFGCGAGRILRGLPKYTDAKLFGCDIDVEAMEWCSAHLTMAEFGISTEYPPSKFEDDRFDFVYAISVLTHLDETHQDAWLEEWLRIVKPGGFVLATFRDKDWIHSQPKGWVADNNSFLVSQIEDSGIYFHEHNDWVDSFPSYYQGTFHSSEYVREHWSNFFEILDIFPQGKLLGQNSALMRKPAL